MSTRADRAPSGHSWRTEAARQLQVVWRWVRRTWRRNLPLRVITITVLIGAIMSIALGGYMYQRISDGLVDAKMASSEQEALSKRSEAQVLFTNAAHTDMTSLRQLVQDTVVRIASPGGDESRRVVMMQSLDNTSQTIPAVSSAGASSATVPDDIRNALRRDPTHEQVKIITVTSGDSRVPAVLIGSRVSVPNAGAYDLYFIFPMGAEVHTLSIIRGAFAVGGLGLVLLLVGLAYLVTRMVVEPIRSAAHVAERLTVGALNERMQIRGDDDIARLASSFNAMADSLQRQIRQLEELSSLQQRFASDVSHELRTPLTTIRMAVDMIHDRREEFPPPVSRSAELLLREVDRFEALLTDLLEISRFDAGAAGLHTSQVDLRDVVRRVVESHESLADRLGVRLRVFARNPAVAPMDERRIERIVRNLVTNAIEHAEHKPVDITVAAGRTAVAVSVRDYGVGLDPGQEAMVFNRFWRADPARARTTGGTGLGLSISLEDARLHDGWLEAWGARGEGSCFRLTLPIQLGVAIQRSPTSLQPDDSATDITVVGARPPVPAGAPSAQHDVITGRGRS